MVINRLRQWTWVATLVAGSFLLSFIATGITIHASQRQSLSVEVWSSSFSAFSTTFAGLAAGATLVVLLIQTFVTMHERTCAERREEVRRVEGQIDAIIDRHRNMPHWVGPEKSCRAIAPKVELGFAALCTALQRQQRRQSDYPEIESLPSRSVVYTRYSDLELLMSALLDLESQIDKCVLLDQADKARLKRRMDIDLFRVYWNGRQAQHDRMRKSTKDLLGGLQSTSPEHMDALVLYEAGFLLMVSMSGTGSGCDLVAIPDDTQHSCTAICVERAASRKSALERLRALALPTAAASPSP